MRKIVKVRFFNSFLDKKIECTCFVIRETKRSRIIFSPTLVDKEDMTENHLRGSIIYQRKNDKTPWENMPTLDLNKLKEGEWTRINFNSDEILNLLTYMKALNRIFTSRGMPQGMDMYNTIIGNNITTEDKEEFIEFLEHYPELKEILLENQWGENISQIVKEIQDENNFESLMEFMTLDIGSDLIKSTSFMYLFKAYNEYNDLMNLSIEPDWQKFFENNPRILSSVIPGVGLIWNKKRVVNGSNLEGKEEVITDFILKAGINNFAILEIKKPSSKLMNDSPYRKGHEVYSPSSELSGSVVQVATQKDEFIKNYYVKVAKEKEYFGLFNPKCYILIGNNNNLSPKQSDSFELFRHSLNGIEIITYNEFQEKLESLIKILTKEKHSV
jgi:hypothetical protein